MGHEALILVSVYACVEWLSRNRDGFWHSRITMDIVGCWKALSGSAMWFRSKLIWGFQFWSRCRKLGIEPNHKIGHWAQSSKGRLCSYSHSCSAPQRRTCEYIWWFVLKPILRPRGPTSTPVNAYVNIPLYKWPSDAYMYWSVGYRCLIGN